MKVILYMVISVNGIISKKDGIEDFISLRGWEEAVKLAKKYGNLIWGRRTYENAFKVLRQSDLDQIKAVDKIVISENKNLKLIPGFHRIESPEKAIDYLEKKGFKTSLLDGGATLNSFFAKSKMIDEIIFLVEPVVVGDGIPVFASEDFEIKLELLQSEKLDGRILKLQYSVIK
ncbi:dihydrofolate reductase family protein [Candidatus Microgenomates bacterium]|nr:dihydrofolate reductase family protein [Candidatus Microgenomates bacterium]